jgi:hypothetical protein
MPIPADNILQTIKQGIVDKLTASDTEWFNIRSIQEVVEFGPPPKTAQRLKTIQLMLQQENSGQGGGLLIADVSVHVAAVVRSSHDNEGRYDRMLQSMRTALNEAKRLLEGQSFNFLHIPLWMVNGPTVPEVFELDPMYSFSFISFEGQRIEENWETVNVESFDEWDQGYEEG